MGRIFSRSAAVLKKYGIAGFFGKLHAYVKANFFDKINPRAFFGKKKYKREISKILDAGGHDRVILYRNSFGYDADMFQRPQHLAANLAKCGCLVFYEVTSVTDKVKTYKKQRDGLYLFNFNNILLNKILMRELERRPEPKYALVCSTDWKLSDGDIDRYMNAGFGFVYDYIDHISPELTGTKEIPPSISGKYSRVMRDDAVTVVVTSGDLRDDVVSKRGERNLVLAGNGVDCGFFTERDPSFKLEKDFTDVINNGRINVCYYGALAKWFDYGLVKKAAATGRYNFILFGVKYDGSYDEEKMSEVDNVYFFGRKDYKVLKYYAAACDVLTIPFCINPITQATSPLKLYEYMALEKPVVTTAMKECAACEAVFAAKSHDEFIRCLDEAYSMRDDAEYLSRLRVSARANDWSEKAKLIVNILQDNR